MVTRGRSYILLTCLAAWATVLPAQSVPDTSEYLVVRGLDIRSHYQGDNWLLESLYLTPDRIGGKKGMVVIPGAETSFVIEFHTTEPEKVPAVYQLTGTDKIRINADHDHEDGTTPDNLPQSIFSRQLFHGPEPGTIVIGKTEVAVTLHFIYAARFTVLPMDRGRQYKTDDCLKPPTILPSEWRTGLPSPTITPLKTDVYHCIIHHSAGSNTDTNYTDIVRNIYLYHTQVRGWDDIGYNYLVAQNGHIFSGRDPQGVADEDRIQGAHYCAKNSGTLGICLLGDYETASLPDKSFSRVSELLAWKLHKESLSTFSERPHPYPGGAVLASIAGHRDGCATVCPGKNVYSLLDSLREVVQLKLDDCQPVSVENTPGPSLVLVQGGPEFRINGDPSKVYHYLISDVTGRLISNGSMCGNSVQKMEATTHGLFILQLEDAHNNSYVFKLIY